MYIICKLYAFFLLGNTKIIGQNALQRFQEELGQTLKDPYQVVMHQTKLPITLLNETGKVLLNYPIYDIKIICA